MLTGAQADRAAGVLVGLASGDALGAGYEFQPPLVNGESIDMIGGGTFGWEPGEWTDDTSLAIAIAEVAARGQDLRHTDALDTIVQRLVGWLDEAKDVPLQSAAVLEAVRDEPTAAAATARAAEDFARTRATGNGSLMRTAAVSLAYLNDPDALAQAAYTVSSLTQGNREAGEACVLLSQAIRHAVVHGNFDGLRLAVADLPRERAAIWNARLDEAESVQPKDISPNTWPVGALMACWSAICNTPVPTDDAAHGSFPANHFMASVESAVRAGSDADTVGAITGALLAARWGVSAIPWQWQRILHGWPGFRARDLVALGIMSASAGEPADDGWPSAAAVDYSRYPDLDRLVAHPFDSGVLLGGVGILRALPADVDAVVSLCRLGSAEVPGSGVAVENHLEIWIDEEPTYAANPNLALVLSQAADAVASLRAEGHTVLLHCVVGQTQTPAVAVLYATRHLGTSLNTARQEVFSALNEPGLGPDFDDAVRRVSTAA
jgi:ADP-ribosyl-[dinitrogen reductase] hydrolase